MKFAIVFAALFAVAIARPQNPADQQATVVSQQSDISPDLRTYSFSSQTSNGIQQQEAGQLQQPSTPEESPAYATQGEFTYTGPDGVQYTVRYTADKNGFHPEGAHIPKAL